MSGEAPTADKLALQSGAMVLRYGLDHDHEELVVVRTSVDMPIETMRRTLRSAMKYVDQLEAERA